MSPLSGILQPAIQGYSRTAPYKTAWAASGSLGAFCVWKVSSSASTGLGGSGHRRQDYRQNVHTCGRLIRNTLPPTEPCRRKRQMKGPLEVVVCEAEASQARPDHHPGASLSVLPSRPPSLRPVILNHLQRNTHTPREMGQLSSLPCSTWTQLPSPLELTVSSLGSRAAADRQNPALLSAFLDMRVYIHLLFSKYVLITG